MECQVNFYNNLPPFSFLFFSAADNLMSADMQMHYWLLPRVMRVMKQ